VTTSTRSLIIVEDEPLIAMLIEDMVEEIGWEVEGLASDEEGALELPDAGHPLLALIDLNLDNGSGLPVASRCRERNIPVVFITGYDRSKIPPEFSEAPLLTKPLTSTDLAAAMTSASAVMGVERRL
jgi:DNA-binding response OmpR family regulator